MLKTTTGITASGEYIHIKDSANGKSCQCFCPACKTPLIAKQGEVLSWHFAHTNSNNVTSACGESDLHLNAKLEIYKSMQICAPIMFEKEICDGLFVPGTEVVDFTNYLKTYYGVDVTENFVLSFDSMKIESRLDGFIPDLIGWVGAKQFIIEVVVTHDIDEKKLKWIKENEINCLRLRFSTKKSDGSQSKIIAEPQADWVFTSQTPLYMALRLCEQNEFKSKESAKYFNMEIDRLNQYIEGVKKKYRQYYLAKEENEKLISRIELLEGELESKTNKINEMMKEKDSMMDEKWQEVLLFLPPLSQALFKHYSTFLSIRQETVTIGVKTRQLKQIAEMKKIELCEAFEKVFGKKITINFILPISEDNPIPILNGPSLVDEDDSIIPF